MIFCNFFLYVSKLPYFSLSSFKIDLSDNYWEKVSKIILEYLILPCLIFSCICVGIAFDTKSRGVSWHPWHPYPYIYVYRRTRKSDMTKELREWYAVWYLLIKLQTSKLDWQRQLWTWLALRPRKIKWTQLLRAISWLNLNQFLKTTWVLEAQKNFRHSGTLYGSVALFVWMLGKKCEFCTC